MSSDWFLDTPGESLALAAGAGSGAGGGVSDTGMVTWKEKVETPLADSTLSSLPSTWVMVLQMCRPSPRPSASILLSVSFQGFAISLCISSTSTPPAVSRTAIRIWSLVPGMSMARRMMEPSLMADNEFLVRWRTTRSMQRALPTTVLLSRLDITCTGMCFLVYASMRWSTTCWRRGLSTKGLAGSLGTLPAWNITTSATSWSTSDRRMDDARSSLVARALSSTSCPLEVSMSALKLISLHGVLISCSSLRSSASFCLCARSSFSLAIAIWASRIWRPVSSRMKQRVWWKLPSAFQLTLLSIRRCLSRPSLVRKRTGTSEMVLPVPS
mmetsp:Transcript_39684/g.75906  ORF Transcript_39684/g.75906 Transcript_39684/m.75906 type:complete len:327 (+) Transcript_39684:1358-2338(+)